MSKQKKNLPRSVVDGLMQQFDLVKHLTGSDRQAVYAVAQRLLRVITKIAVNDGGDFYSSCKLCDVSAETNKPEDIDHNEDCPLSWIDPIKL